MSAMETCKIQQVGGGTYTVSLPKEWATAADIELGAVVELHSHIDGTLVVQTDAEESCEEPLQLSVGDAEPTDVARTLRAAYAAGVDSVELDAPGGISEETHRLIEQVSRTLTGVTVTESDGQSMRVRSLLDVEEVSITQSVRQLQFAALSAHREATDALTSPTGVEPVAPDGQPARIAAMVDHYFRRGLDSLSVMDALGLTRPELFVRWVTARELARVADHADRVARVAGRLDDTIERDTADTFDDLADQSRELVRTAVGVVLDDASAARARRLLDDWDRLSAEIQSLDRRLFETDGVDYRLTHAIDALDRTTDRAGDIAEMGLQSVLGDRRPSASLDIGSTAQR